MDFSTYNPQQKEAVFAPHKPLLIVAGAGTGKTKTLTGRIIRLLEEGVLPSQVCALTFTNKAAGEMRGRVETALRQAQDNALPKIKAVFSGAMGRQPFIGTFHSLGARILREEYRSFGRSANFAIFDAYDSLQLVKKALKKSVQGAYKLKPAIVANTLSRIKSGSVSREFFEESPRAEDQLIASLLDTYEEELENNNAFDFDDLIEKPVRLFKKNPLILKKYHQRFAYFLVDEYQDVNNMQYGFIKFLASGSCNLSVVGDDQQTIYSWRGSNFEIFLNFERDWPEAQVIMLEQNYRSSGNIIRTASELIQHNTRQKQKNLWTTQVKGASVTIIEMPEEYAQARWLAQHIATQAIAGGDNQQETTAILYRTNAQSRAIEQALLEADIPYHIFGGVEFYGRREIKDVVAAVRFLSNPKDQVSRERLEKNLTKHATALFFAKAAESSRLLKPDTAIKLFLETIGYFAYLEKNFINALERQENIAELLSFSSTFADLSSFLEKVALVQATDTNPKRSPGQNDQYGMRALLAAPVSLMTMHMAKGLEFDAVYVVGCNEGVLPHNRSLYSIEELEEERRLLYVAMTRARQRLHLSFYNIPSRFLTELPADTVRFETTNGEAMYDLEDEERYITLD